MPATARIALSREARQAARATETPPAETARLWADVLGRVPLFASVPARQVRKIASLGSLARYEAEDADRHRGRSGRGVLRHSQRPRQDPARTRTCRRRNSAQVPTSARWRSSTARARSATIVAETETTCLMLTRKRFAKVLRGEPTVALALLGDARRPRPRAGGVAGATSRRAGSRARARGSRGSATAAPT